jgi:hypothetical protein
MGKPVCARSPKLSEKLSYLKKGANIVAAKAAILKTLEELLLKGKKSRGKCKKSNSRGREVTLKSAVESAPKVIITIFET